MAVTPVVLVDGLAPPPLGSSSNGTKSLGATPSLTLQSLLGITAAVWTLTSKPSTSTATLATPNATASTVGPLDAVGTYLVKVVANGDANSVAEFAITVLTSRGDRIPAIGEETQWDPTGWWQKAIYDFMAKSAAVVAGAYKTLTYSASIATDASLGTTFEVDVSNGSAFTLLAPTNPVAGQKITYLINNISGGAMGVITWTGGAGGFMLAGAFTNPNTGKVRTITFTYTGSRWFEDCRAAADI